jgi:hypothetical protein
VGSTTTTKPKDKAKDKAKDKDTPPPEAPPPVVVEPLAPVDTPPALWIPPASETAGANQAPVASEGAVKNRREGAFPYEGIVILLVMLAAIGVVIGAVRRAWRERGSYFSA